MQVMQPLDAWPLAERAALLGVFTDIDDTLTTDGALQPATRAALQALRDAGMPLIAITGRPTDWCAHFLSGFDAWPVTAMVAENGAVAFIPQADGCVEKIYADDATTRARNGVTLQRAAQAVLREVPGAQLATDSPGRETDIAIDHREFARLSPEQIAQVQTVMRREGLTATVSSIHVNGWVGDHSKLSGARWMLRHLWQRNLDAEINRWAYVGDSTNDALMFATLPQSIGVANVRRFQSQLTALPRYVTPSERGAGFVEVVAAILQAR